jgi:hypothetical protein
VVLFIVITIAAGRWIHIGLRTNHPEVIAVSELGQLLGLALSETCFLLMLCVPIALLMVLGTLRPVRMDLSTALRPMQFTMYHMFIGVTVIGAACGGASMARRYATALPPYERMCVAWWTDQVCLSGIALIAGITLLTVERPRVVLFWLLPLSCSLGAMPAWAGNIMPYYPVPFFDEPVRPIALTAIVVRNAVYTSLVVIFVLLLRRAGYRLGWVRHAE